MNIKYVPINGVADVGFKNYFALVTFVGTVHEWGQLYELFKTENYLKQKAILKQHFWTQIFLIKVSLPCSSSTLRLLAWLQVK